MTKTNSLTRLVEQFEQVLNSFYRYVSYNTDQCLSAFRVQGTEQLDNQVKSSVSDISTKIAAAISQSYYTNQQLRPTIFIQIQSIS